MGRRHGTHVYIPYAAGYSIYVHSAEFSRVIYIHTYIHACILVTTEYSTVTESLDNPELFQTSE